ncbi:hypothetical protein [Desulfoscipio geothermicus]|uniref:CAAX protease self-immunity n=1 Tax=Desulfoscipio geothermicus DSM 3669 TaxID=1121426 RepID=A0A1I6DG47_9FIRM|nr:hypothetical protein [Desulfoscipio geothermicus]SFR04425.1 hypothetical protein SAMN05660706_11066 [Desulfoscipio geothermicus DSM 3669]
MHIFAGLFAALAARVMLGLVRRSDTRAVITLVAPAVEELAKTGLALFWGADIFYTHVVFGGAELAADSLKRRGIWPGLAALALHSALGFVTVWLAAYTGVVALAAVAATVLHSLWNYAAVTLLGPRV